MGVGCEWVEGATLLYGRTYVPAELHKAGSDHRSGQYDPVITWRRNNARLLAPPLDLGRWHGRPPRQRRADDTHFRHATGGGYVAPLGYSAIRKGETSRAFDSELAPAQLPGNMVPLLLSWIIRNCATPRDFCLEVISPTLYTYRSHMYLARDFFSATRSSSLSSSSPNPGSCAPNKFRRRTLAVIPYGHIS